MLKTDTQRSWWLAVLLVVAVFIAYQPVWHAGFVWDDDEFLTANPTVKSVDFKNPDCLRQLWFTKASLDYYPMTYTMWWAEWHLWHNNPSGYHLINILLHALSAVLLWRVFILLKIPGATLAAAIFALHPVNVESVAWISEGKNALAMFFYAGTLLSWLKFEDDGKRRWYGLALVGFALALFSKTAVVPLPFVLLGLAWWRRGKVEWADVWRAVPFFVLAGILGMVTVWFHHHRAFGNDIVRTDSFWSRLAGAGWAIWFYFYKAVLPVNLSFVYPRWEINAASVLSYVPLLLLVAALALCWRFAKSTFFGLGYFVLMLLPVVGFLSIYFMRYSLVADHWEYFAIIGPIVLIACAIDNRILAGAVLLALGILTRQQCADYTSSERLWRATLARNPDSSMVRNNLSRDLLLRGRAEEAVRLSESVLATHPDDFTAHFNLAEGLRKKGQLPEAIAQFEKALALQPDNASVCYNIGDACLKAGRFDDAVRYFEKAIHLQPDYAEAFCNLGFALLQQGHQDEAIAAYGKALQLNPRYALAHNDLGSILSRLGRSDEAVRHFQQAVEIQPDFAEAHFNLGGLYAHQGHVAAAISEYETVLKIRPNTAQACNGLAWLLAAGPDAALHNGAKAIELAQRADKLAQGRNPIFLATLAAAYAETGQFDEAVKTIDRALPLAESNAALTRALQQRAAAYAVKQK